MKKLTQYKENLLNEFEARSDEWTYGDFDIRLSEIKLGQNYQHVKEIILSAHESRRWPNTVKRYLLTNFRVFNNVSGEYAEVFREIYSNLSQEEKKYWDVK